MFGMQISPNQVKFSLISFGVLNLLSNVGGFSGAIFAIFSLLYSFYYKAFSEIDSVKNSFKIRANKTTLAQNQIFLGSTIN